MEQIIPCEDPNLISPELVAQSLEKSKVNHFLN